MPDTASGSSTVGPVNAGVPFGGLLIGCFCSILLFGSSCVQAYSYALRNRDSKRLKFTVFFVWLLEAVHTLIITHAVYNIAVDNFSNFAIFQTYSSFKATIYIGPIITTIVELFFMYRIYILSNQWLIVVALGLILTARTAVTMVLGIRLMVSSFAEVFQNYGWAVISSLVLSSIIDVATTLLLLYYLQKGRRLSRRTDKAIHKLVALTLESGLATTAVGVSIMICYIVLPFNSVWIGLIAVWTKAYSNSLFASLNARFELQNYFRGEQTPIPPTAPSVVFMSAVTGGTASSVSSAAVLTTKSEPYEAGKPSDPDGRESARNTTTLSAV